MRVIVTEAGAGGRGGGEGPAGILIVPDLFKVYALFTVLYPREY